MIFYVVIKMRSTSVPGLFYDENFLSESEVNELKRFIEELNFVPIIENSNGRKVVQYGYSYQYDRSILMKTHDIPDILKKLAEKIMLHFNVMQPFDQIIINRYLPNQIISKHIDNVKYFGPEIACISLGATRKMLFTNGNFEYQFYPTEGSVYIMKDDARYRWEHEIVGKSGTRYSVTFRSINQEYVLR